MTTATYAQPFGRPIDASTYPELARRRQLTNDRWLALRVSSRVFWPRLQHADRNTSHISDRACIYVTGSIARGEGASFSDLDLFIIDDLPVSKEDQTSRGRLNYVEQARLVSALDELRSTSEFRPFSRGGEFIQVHSFQTILKEIGAPNDDFSNSFTARLLLLMNSQPLLNTEAYLLAREEVLNSYWDRSDPEENFLPIMLTNDIRRWWGVLCLNFENSNRRLKDADYTSSPKRRLDNLKLRYSKLLAVYSTLLELVDRSGPRGLSRTAALEVFNALPIDRVLNVASRHEPSSGIAAYADEVLKMYDSYLAFVSREESALLEVLADETSWAAQQSAAFKFHEVFVRLFATVGADRSPLYEYCIV